MLLEVVRFYTLSGRVLSWWQDATCHHDKTRPRNPRPFFCFSRCCFWFSTSQTKKKVMKNIKEWMKNIRIKYKTRFKILKKWSIKLMYCSKLKLGICFSRCCSWFLTLKIKKKWKNTEQLMKNINFKYETRFNIYKFLFKKSLCTARNHD